MAEIVGPVADSLVQSLVGAAKEHIKYVREYKTYVKNLRDELENLEAARVQIQHAVDEASSNAQNIEEAVTKWIDAVNGATNEARDLLEKNNKSKKSCFRGIIPNPSRRFQISRQAENIVRSISKLEEKKNQLGRISYRSVPLGRVTGTYTGANYHVTKSREDILKEINKALMDSDVRIVGVSGPSGVGKSVLMKQVEKQVKERKLGYDFDDVANVTVTQAHNSENIQDDIAYRLGLKFENENGVDHKAHRLRERLQPKKKTLIILDDLWKKLDLDRLGIPLGGDYSHIKLLLTSRSKEMLINEMNSRLNLTLKPLEEEEAMELFEKIVGYHNKDELIQELLQKQLVEGCAGLPAFIIPIATKLKRIPLSSWNETLNNLKRSDNEGMKKFVEETLGIEYQVIEAEEVKALFLLCGQIGNQILPIDDLLIYGMGLGFLKGDTIEECREKLKSLLESLKSNGLLEEEASNYIKIHDLVSEVSLSIAKSDQHSLVLRKNESLDNCEEDELKRCKSISFPYADDINKLPEGLICPELNMFLLYTEECSLNFPNSFFNGMRKLKVMVLSGVVLTALPSSIELLNEIHTLCLDRCIIEDLRSIGKLEKLQMLTFRRSKVSRLPKEIGDLIHLRLLDLSGCYGLKVIEPNVLGRLIHLEELALPETFNRWEVEGANNASLNELSNMSCLSHLKICIPDVDMLPHDLPFRNLKRYKILIGAQWDYFIEYDEERTLLLKLNWDNSKIIWEDWIQATLKRAQKIQLLGWRGIERGIIEISKGGFLELKHIDIQYSPRIQYIFCPNVQFQFSFLESIHLYKLINLEKVYQGSLTMDSFTNLKSLRIKACHKLQNLFSISLVKELSRVEEIEVEDCKMISEIVTFDLVDDSLEQKGGTIDNKLKVTAFERLHTLTLSSLPNILSFCAITQGNRMTNKGDGSSQIVFLNTQQVSLPCLESLTLSAIPLLEKISHSESPVELRRLRILKIEACESLSIAIDSRLLLQLKSLEELTIENCESMNTVFNLDKSSANEVAKSLVVPKPLSLKLVDLRTLETIWRMNLKGVSLVQNLKQLQVSGCERLKCLFWSSMAKSLQSVSHISIANCKEMEIIFKEEKKDDDDTRDTIEFSSLTELKISDMESLTMFASGNRYLDFPCLKQIEVSNCPKMSTFVPSKNEKKLSRTGTFFTSKYEKKPSRTATTQNAGGVRYESFFSAKAILPSLEKLVLSSLESLTNMWEISLSKDSLCKLASLEIKDSENLKTIFPLALMGRMQNLAELEVKNCKALGVLFESGERELMMSKLKEMSLCQLPKLKHLVMKGSSKEATLEFPNLTNIKLSKCGDLVDLLPNATTRTLSVLENLEIASCSSIVEVFSAVTEDEEMAFSRLCCLKLEALNSLTSFCTGRAKHYFPFLKELSIIRCPKLKAFISTPPNPASNEDESRPLFDEKVIFPNLRELRIQGLKIKEMWHNELPARFLCKLKNLVVEDCNELSSLIPLFMMNNLQSLDSLIVTECNSLEVIFELEGHAFSSRKHAKSRSWKLKSIKLFDLPNLKCICKSASFTEHFPFDELVSLEVQSCESLEQVFENGKDGHTGGCKRIVFSHLSSLKLFELPKLISFCAKHTTKWPALEELVIRDCDVVEALGANSEQPFKPLFLLEKVAFPKIGSLIISKMSNLKEIWHTTKEAKDLECSLDAFGKLKTLQIDDCKSLTTILSSKMIRGFQYLEELIVRRCNSLEQVFYVQGNKVHSYNNEEVIAIDFSLREIELSSLPIMKQVWNIENPEGVQLSFEKLQRVYITSCDGIKHLFPTSVAKYLHQLERVKVTSCNEMEEIVSREHISTNTHVDADKKFFFFPKATHLALRRLPNLKSILYLMHWPSLEELKVYACPNVKILAAERWNTINDTSRSSSNEFDNISYEQINHVKKVNISKLKSVKTDMISEEDGQFPYDFLNLEMIRLRYIEDEEAIKKFPWKLLLEKIHNFPILRISYSAFKELFPLVDEEAHGHEEGEEEQKEIVRYKSGGLASKGKQKHALGTLKTQNLKKLMLDDLDELQHVWKQDSIMADILNIVESLHIVLCDSLKILFPSSASFLNLTKLSILCCHGMVNLVTSSAARCLVQLTELRIYKCDKMENIVIEDEDENGVERVNVAADDISISFPRLKELRLLALTKLESFSSTTCHFNFPSLESVYLWDLPKLEDFCKGGFTAPILHEVYAVGQLGHEVNLLN